jgi:DNA-binding FadR family transcriptional regulator
MTSRQVRRSTVSNKLTDRVTAALRQDIISGKYEPGRQLPAGKDLSATFGVSITVVRESLSRLKSDGLIASHEGKGVFVEDDARARPFRLATAEGAKSSLRHIFELRMGVEMQAATLAAERCKAGDPEGDARLPEADGAEQEQLRAGARCHIAFHLTIAQARQNPLIVSFMKFLWPHLYESISKARASSARKTRTALIAYSDHYAICEAVVACEPHRARLATRRVLERSLRRLENE